MCFPHFIPKLIHTTYGCVGYSFVKIHRYEHHCFQIVNSDEGGERRIANRRNTRIGCAIVIPDADRKIDLSGIKRDTKMQDIISMLHTLKRPRLLMRAAKIGARDYRRTVHLPRLLGYGHLPRNGPALMKLIEIEGELNTQRKAEESAYSLMRHIDVMIAIVGEAHILRTTQISPAELSNHDQD